MVLTMPRVRRLALVCLLVFVVVTVPAVLVAADGNGSVYRVFLATGEALPSYGEPAIVGDRVIFNLYLGESAAGPVLQLVSLPTSSVDLARTRGYAESMRAALYDATRGASDYAAMSAEVSRSLEELKAVADPQKRLLLAQEARQRLLDWSASHYQYRADDIRELAGLFDEVINELRVAAGQPALSFDLSSGAPRHAPLLPTPSLQEAVMMALAAAGAADVGAERVAILRTASAQAASAGPALGRIVAGHLAEEERIEAAYASLLSTALRSALAAEKGGDLAGLLRVQENLIRRDQELGHRRPSEVRALDTQLTSMVKATWAYRTALEAYTRQRGSLLAYDRSLRPVLDEVDAQAGVLTSLRDELGAPPGRVRETEVALARAEQTLHAIHPPGALVSVHATLVSALRMASEACARRHDARTSVDPAARQASSAAAGSLLLFARARHELAASLEPPTLH